MKIVSKLHLGFSLSLGFSLVLLACAPDTSKDVLITPPPPPPEAAQISEGQRYVQKVMTACGAKLSEAKTNILSLQDRKSVV